MKLASAINEFFFEYGDVHVEHMLCPNYQHAPFINDAAPTINIFMLIVGAPVYKRCCTNYQQFLVPTINIC